MCVIFISRLRIGTHIVFQRQFFIMFICLSLTRRRYNERFFLLRFVFFCCCFINKNEKITFLFMFILHKDFPSLVWFRWRLKYNLSLAHFINIPTYPLYPCTQCTLFNIFENAHIMFFIVYISS